MNEETKHEVEAIECQAAIISVHDNSSRMQAISMIKELRLIRDRISTFFVDIKKKTHDAWKSVVAQENFYIDRINVVERQLKSRVELFDREEEEKRLAEQRRLQAEAEEAARRERERLERQAAKLKTVEKKEALMEEAASIVAPVIHVESVVEKTPGESTRTTWKARLTNMESLWEAAAKQDNAFARRCLCYDAKAADALAKAMKDTIKVPGVEFYKETTLALRTQKNC